MKYFYKWQILLCKTYFYLYLQNCHFNDKHEIQAQHELFEKDLASVDDATCFSKDLMKWDFNWWYFWLNRTLTDDVSD